MRCGPEVLAPQRVTRRTRLAMALLASLMLPACASTETVTVKGSAMADLSAGRSISVDGRTISLDDVTAVSPHGIPLGVERRVGEAWVPSRDGVSRVSRVPVDERRGDAPHTFAILLDGCDPTAPEPGSVCISGTERRVRVESVDQGIDVELRAFPAYLIVGAGFALPGFGVLSVAESCPTPGKDGDVCIGVTLGVGGGLAAVGLLVMGIGAAASTPAGPPPRATLELIPLAGAGGVARVGWILF